MTDWYYLAEKRRRGPVPLKTLLEYVLSQPNPHEVPVNRKGLKSWVPAMEVPELASLLPPLRPGYKRPKYKSKVGLGLRDATEDRIFFITLGVAALLSLRLGLLGAVFSGIIWACIMVAVSRLFRRKQATR